MAAYDNVQLLGTAVARDISRRLRGSELLFEWLLCAGFLVTRDPDSGVVRCREARDHRELPSRLVLEEGVDGEREVRFSTDVDDPASYIGEMLKVGPPENVFTAITCERESWPQFRALRYGVRFQPGSLELGVALLVRTLPLITVPTEVSGHGRDGSFFLRVKIDGSYGRAWFRFLLEQELRHVLPALDVEVLRQGLRYSERIALGAQNENEARALASFWRGQRLARVLLDKERCEEVRTRRRRIVDSFERGERPTPEEFRCRCADMWGGPVWPVADASVRDEWARFQRQFPVGPVQCVREPPAGAGAHTVLLAAADARDRFHWPDIQVDADDWSKLIKEVNRRGEIGALPEKLLGMNGSLVSAFPVSLIEEARADEIVRQLLELRVAISSGQIRTKKVVLDIAPVRWSEGVEAAFVRFSKEIAADGDVSDTSWVWVTGT